MRLGVLDVGSNTVHLLVVDAHRGADPEPMRSDKTQLRLAEHVEAGRLTRVGADALVRAVTRAKAAAAAAGCAELLAFATSALRDAENSAAVLARVAAETGVALQVLPGEDEARYTFLAVRRWYGWSAGRLLVLDIGGGSLELAAGRDEDPEVAFSLPLGAGRLTRGRFRSDPPSRRELEALAEELDAVLGPAARPITELGAHDLAVGTSKTFRSLARLAGAAPSSAGLRVRRSLTDVGLSQVVGFISRISAARSRRTGRGQRGARPPAGGRCDGGGRRHACAAGGRAADLPVGVARGRDPASPRRPRRARGGAAAVAADRSARAPHREDAAPPRRRTGSLSSRSVSCRDDEGVR